jgi:hypothetical protein
LRRQQGLAAKKIVHIISEAGASEFVAVRRLQGGQRRHRICGAPAQRLGREAADGCLWVVQARGQCGNNF